MKKSVILMAVIMASVTTAMAQSAVAVLSHEGSTKTFNGYTALQEAYAEAVNGDLITLSSGTFGAIGTIEKAIKIRGAGMEVDTVYHTASTIINGDMTLSIVDDGINHFCLEGIYHADRIYYKKKLVKPEFVKCRLSHIYYGSYTELGASYTGIIDRASFYHCKIVTALSCNEKSSITFVNCLIKGAQARNDSTSVMTFYNCDIMPAGISGWGISLKGCTMYNCIIDYVSSYNDKSHFIDCVISNSNSKPDKSKNTYRTYQQLSAVYKTYNGSYSNTETFETLEGFENVGIHSGSFPYSPRVSGPHIQQMEVAPHTTESGTLNVKMKIETTTN